MSRKYKINNKFVAAILLSIFVLISLTGCGAPKRITSSPSGLEIDYRSMSGDRRAVPGPWYTPDSVTPGINYGATGCKARVKWPDGTWSDYRVCSSNPHFVYTTFGFSINSNPINATVYCGSNENSLEYFGVTPLNKIFSSSVRMPFRYCKAEKDGYESQTKSIHRNNNNYEINFNLNKRLVVTIVERIISTPSGGEIYWGDSKNNLHNSGHKTPYENTYTGYTPSITRKWYQVKKTGYQNIQPLFFDKTTSDRNVIFDLQKTPYGYVRFTSNQKGVDIYIDDKLEGNIAENPFVAKLPAGQHIVTAKKPLFGSKSINIRVDANDSFAYQFELQESGNMAEQMDKGKIVQSTGTLIIASIRNDLTVTIDGSTKKVPFKLPSIASGRYKAMVSGNGVNKEIELVIKENEKTFVDLDDLL